MLVVAGGQAAPLLEQAEGAFDDVAALVPVGVVGDRAPTGGAAALAVALLVAGLGDDRDDAAAAQLGSDRPGGVRLVGQEGVGPGARAARTQARDADGVQDR